MKKLISLVLIFLLAFSMVACTKKEDTNTTTPTNAEVTTEATEATTEPVVEADVRVYVTYQGEKFITFNESTPFTAPDGTVYKKGDLLPTWQYIAGATTTNIIDATPKSGSNELLLLEQAAATKFQDANVFVGSPRTISDYGIEGYFIPLNEHFDKMPNFKAFLEANPAVEASLTQADGNIYLTPYFDDIDQLERMFIMRLDWVKKLLDEESPAFDTAKKIATEYDAFYDYAGGKTVLVGKGNKQTIQINKNIITIQNELSAKDGASLAQALRDYIDANYMNAQTGYTNRSDLFISSEAAYDADELIALMRAVKANPVYLTGENKDLTVFFPRRIQEAARVRMLGAIWGIQGVDARNNFYYFNENNEVVDARLDEKYLTGLENLNKLYKEGLILSDYEQARGQVNDFRSINFQTNDGFLTYDYAASTVALHDLIPAEQMAIFGTEFEPVVPAAAKWFGNEFEHFAESNRSVKTEGGWGIAAHTSGDALNAALRLVDFPFSEDGLNVMSFGPKGLYWNEYIEFGGKQVPKIVDQFNEDRNTYASGNWSNFMRGFIGSTFGVGHVKQTLAIEAQVSNEHYANGINRITNSPTKLAAMAGDADARRRVVPTIFPLNEDQLEAISVNTFGQYYDEWQTRVIKYGFGAKIPNSTDAVPTKDQFVQDLKDKGIEQQTRIMNQAYSTIK